MIRTAFLVFVSLSIVGRASAQVLFSSDQSFDALPTSQADLIGLPNLVVAIPGAEPATSFMLCKNCMANPSLYSLGAYESSDPSANLFSKVAPVTPEVSPLVSARIAS